MTETEQIPRNRPHPRRRFVIGGIALVLVAASIAFTIDPASRHGAQVFRSAVRHGAANRYWKQPYPPNFDDPDYDLPLKIRIPGPLQRHAGPLDPPGTGVTASDSALFLGEPFAPPPVQRVYDRVFQWGYWLGWNWPLWALLTLALIGGGIAIRKRVWHQ